MNERLLVIRFSSLGDILLTSPVIVNLRIAFPHGRIAFLTKQRFRSVVELIDGVDDIFTIADNASIREMYACVKNLNSVGFTHLIDLHGNQRSWLTRTALTADCKVVYPKRRLERRRIVRRRNKVLPSEYPHTIDLYNEALSRLSVGIHARRPLINRERHAARTDSDGRARVVIAPGAAHLTKQWGENNFRELAVTLHRHRDAHIVWATTSDRGNQCAVEGFVPKPDLTVLVDSPIPDLAGEIALADLTIANDSGIAHLSSAVGTPVLAIFGPTHPALGFAPRGLFDRVVEVDEWCRPCSLHGRRPCFREEQFCFSRIPVDRVVAEASEMLAEHRNRRPALFVDRDGTVIVEKEFIADPDDVELEQGAARALRTAIAHGYRIVIVSNQSGVARGLFTLESVDRVNARMIELLQADRVNVDGVYYCPYHREGTVSEYAKDSDFRKPSPGMPERAAVDLDIDLRSSVVIGDRESDLDLGRTIGARSFLVRTGYGRESEKRMPPSIRAARVFDTLDSVIAHITKEDLL